MPALSSTVPVGVAPQHRLYSAATAINTLAGIVADVGTNPTTVTVYGTLSYGSLSVIPSNIILDLSQGMIDCNNVVGAVTIHGAILAPPEKQIFVNAPAGCVVFGGGGFKVAKVYPGWWGGIGDAVTDSTAAIEAAWKATQSDGYIATMGNTNLDYWYNLRGPELHFTQGQWVYSGTGLDNTRISNPWVTINISGDHRYNTEIIVTSNAYFVDVGGTLVKTSFRNIRVNGGKGAIRSRFTGAIAAGPQVVQDCLFVNYTEAAIQTNSSDFPFWTVQRNTFEAGNDTNAIGIAFGGYVDGVVIDNNDFRKNRIHIKLRRAGNEAAVTNNGYFQENASPTNPRIDLWVVPNTVAALPNQGARGLNVHDNKFGFENRVATDYFIAYADEDTSAGTDNGSFLPKLSADATGFVVGHTIINNRVGAQPTAPIPFVYSTTPHVWHGTYAPNLYISRQITYVLQYRTIPVAVGSTVATPRLVWDQENILWPWNHEEVGVDIAPTDLIPSNDPAQTWGTDPLGKLATYPNTRQAFLGGQSEAGYTPLSFQLVPSLSVSGGASKIGTVTDSRAGTNAEEFAFTQNGAGVILAALLPVTAGRPVWIEFEVLQPATAPMTELVMRTRSTGGTFTRFQRVVSVPSTTVWEPCRFLWQSSVSSASIVLEFLRLDDTLPASRVSIGRLNVYHAREPVDIASKLFVAPDNTLFRAIVDVNKRLVLQNIATNVITPNLDFTTVPISQPGAPTVALAGLGAGNLTNGVYNYRVTFVTLTGETDGSSVGGPVTVVDATTNGQVSITGIGIGGINTIARNVYRTIAGGSTYFLQSQIANNTATTLIDNTADAALGATVAPTVNGTSALTSTALGISLAKQLYAASGRIPTGPPYSFEQSHNTGLWYNGVNGMSLDVAGTSALNIFAGSVETPTVPINAKRIRTIYGTALVAGDFVLSGGWGDAASVGTISGADQRWQATFTSAGIGQAANPTIVLTFHDGTWSTTPFAHIIRNGGTGTGITGFTWVGNATSLTITAVGTPVAGETYTLIALALG